MILFSAGLEKKRKEKKKLPLFYYEDEDILVYVLFWTFALFVWFFFSDKPWLKVLLIDLM